MSSFKFEMISPSYIEVTPVSADVHAGFSTLERDLLIGLIASFEVIRTFS